jgi:hypothetical protein
VIWIRVGVGVVRVWDWLGFRGRITLWSGVRPSGTIWPGDHRSNTDGRPHRIRRIQRVQGMLQRLRSLLQWFHSLLQRFQGLLERIRSAWKVDVVLYGDG